MEGSTCILYEIVYTSFGVIIMDDMFLNMKNISKRYVGVQALYNVDFNIKRGEIHCLVGENGSGKSTLIKIISGVETPDDNSYIEINGKIYAHYSSINSIMKGIEVIYQDPSLFLNLNVAENIALSQIIASGNKFISWKKVAEIAGNAMARIGITLPLDEVASNLSIAEQRLVAICRALTSDVKLLILDEPTTALTKKEVDSLFSVIKDLKAKNIATLFVSHKLDEVLQIAERVTILRDGKKIDTLNREELTNEKLTYLMTGKKIEYSKYSTEKILEKPLLEVKNLKKSGNFADINFSLYEGEIIGITGLLGSGRTELAEALFGINPADSGQIKIQGKSIKIRTIQDAVHKGIGYVPENRMVQGLIMPQSVAKNINITVIKKLKGKLGLIDKDKKNKNIRKWVANLDIKGPSTDAPVQTLSGGNQQRVVLAKWIATNPKILILDGPTVGIDIAAKSSIHDIIKHLAQENRGIIIISDEVQEVLYNCNKIIVMHKGMFIAEFKAEETTEEEIQDIIDNAE